MSTSSPSCTSLSSSATRLRRIGTARGSTTPGPSPSAPSSATSSASATATPTTSSSTTRPARWCTSTLASPSRPAGRCGCRSSCPSASRATWWTASVVWGLAGSSGGVAKPPWRCCAAALRSWWRWRRFSCTTLCTSGPSRRERRSRPTPPAPRSRPRASRSRPQASPGPSPAAGPRAPTATRRRGARCSPCGASCTAHTSRQLRWECQHTSGGSSTRRWTSRTYHGCTTWSPWL
mmetsp:Transcript_120436/g.375028  ORF Transcript_120436/g.375028 Transcript_120436/m.375028 type:complete len:235 (-) Transcript_120436:38-742(-)